MEVLTDVNVTLGVLLKLLPLNGALGVGLEDLVEVLVLGLIGTGPLLSRVVLPRLYSALDTLVVEVGVVLLLETLQDSLELLNARPRRLPLASHAVDVVRQFLDPLLG